MRKNQRKTYKTTVIDYYIATIMLLKIETSISFEK